MIFPLFEGMYLCKFEDKKVLQSEIIDFFPMNARRVVILDFRIARQRKAIEKIFSREKRPVSRKKHNKRQKQRALLQPKQINKQSKPKQEKKRTPKPEPVKSKSKQINLLDCLPF